MPIPNTTTVTAPIAPSSALDVYPTHEDIWGMGGYRVVADVAERNAITLERKKAGMLVYVQAPPGYFKLEADFTTWTAQLIGSGSTSVATDSLWVAKGDLVVGTGLATAIRLAALTDGWVLTLDSTTASGVKWAAGGGGGGSGDVVGPAIATDGVPALFDGATGKLLKNSTPTGTGNPVMATSPTLVTPVLGVATVTSINKVAITAPATGATLTIADGATLTASANATVSGTNTGDQTTVSGNAGTVTVSDISGGGGTALYLVGSTTLTGSTPAKVDTTLVYNTATDTLSAPNFNGVLLGTVNGVVISGSATPTLSVTGTTTVSGANTGDQTTVSGNAGSATVLQTARDINGVAFDGSANITVPAAAGTLTGATLAAGVTASSLISFGNTPTLVTPVLGVAAATSINGLTITTSTGTLTVANGKTATVSNTITLAGTDSTVWTGPADSFSVARIDAAQSFAGIQTFTTSLLNTQTALGAATADGLKVRNTTAAALGAQQWSPSVKWAGLGWGTTASTSQAVEFQSFVTPVQGTVPTGTWTLQSSIAGGAFTTRLTVDSAGQVTSSASLFSGASVQAGVTSAFQWSGRSKILSLSDGNITLENAALTGFTSLNLGPDVATPANVSLKAGSGVGADKTGGNLNVQAGLSTGAGVGGVITFQTSPSTASSSTANTATTAVTIDQNGLTTFAFPLRLKAYTVGTLPTAGTAGRMAYVTDALTPTFLTAVVAGGSVVSPVFDNGTAWVTA